MTISGLIDFGGPHDLYTIHVPAGATLSYTGSVYVTRPDFGWQAVVYFSMTPGVTKTGAWFQNNGPFSRTWSESFPPVSTGQDYLLDLRVGEVGHGIEYHLKLTTSTVGGPACPPGPVTAAETRGCNAAEIQARYVHGYCADPIDTATGNYHETFTDLAIPGRGIPLEYTRSYNATPGQAVPSGSLGYGWTDSYHVSLAVSGVTATVTQETGAQVVFFGSDPTWLPATQRIAASLVHNGDGTWTFTRRGREIFTFDATGKLIKQQDPNGAAAVPSYATTLTYDGSGRLTTVTDPAGRTLTFTHWPTGTGAGKDGLIHTVADSAGRTVTLDYADGNSNLTDVVDAGNGHWQFTYDANHRLLTKREPKFFGDTTTTPTPVVTNTYDASGRVLTQTDPIGRLTSLDYTTVPGSTIVTDPKNNKTLDAYTNGLRSAMTKAYATAQAATWQYEYDPVTIGRTKITDPNEHETTATYDARGNRTSTRDALNRTTAATYNSFNEPLTQTDGRNVTTTSTYDASGNLLSRSTPWVQGPANTNKVVTLHHDDPAHPGDITSITDPDAKTWTYSYDAVGNAISQADPLSNETLSCYDAVGRRTALIGPLGSAAGVACGSPAPAAHTAYFSYNAYGDQLTATDPLGHGTVKTYDANRNVESFADANTNLTAYVYDPANQAIQTTRPDLTALKTAYWPDGTVKSQTDGANNATAYAYDPLAHLTTVTDPNNRVTTYRYDAVGNLLSKQDPGGNCGAAPAVSCTSYGYDVADQLKTVTYSDGVTPNVTNIGYDNNGQRTAMTDGSGTSSWVWDSLRRLVSSTDGAGKTIGYGYDLRDNLTTLVYPGTTGTVTRGYDDAGRLHTVTDWNSRTTTFDYDADNFLTSQAYPNGVTATYTPDGADRLMTISHMNGPNPLASFTYGRDNNDQVTSIASTGVPSDNHSYSYTQLNQLKTQDTANFNYDAADNPTGFANGTTQTFDAANQIQPATSTISLVGAASGGNASTPNTVTVNLPNGTTTNDQIIVAATLQKGQNVTTPTGYTVVGTYNSANGNNSTKVVVYRRTAQAGDSSVAITFGANIAKSVVVAVYRGVNPTNPIDASSSIGNNSATTIAVPSVTTTMNNERLVNIAGEASNAGTWTPPAGMTSQATGSGGATRTLVADQSVPTAGATGTRTDTFSVNAKLSGILLALKPAQITYGFDSRGNRTTTANSGGAAVTLAYDQANRLKSYGTTATYAYNGDGLRVAKTVSGTTTQQAWDHSGALPALLVDGATSYIYGPGNVPIAQVNGTTTLYYHQDQLGSTRALTDSAGGTVATYTYDPFGRRIGSSGTINTPLGFAGQYTDPESGYQYLRSRYYDPTTAQFLTRDPITPITRAPYAYAGDDPLNHTDPAGLYSAEEFVDDVKDVSGYVQVAAAATALIAAPIPGVGEIVTPAALLISTGASVMNVAATCAEAAFFDGSARACLTNAVISFGTFGIGKIVAPGNFKVGYDIGRAVAQGAIELFGSALQWTLGYDSTHTNPTAC